jgi:hypothetical protein
MEHKPSGPSNRQQGSTITSTIAGERAGWMSHRRQGDTEAVGRSPAPSSWSREVDPMEKKGWVQGAADSGGIALHEESLAIARGGASRCGSPRRRAGVEAPWLARAAAFLAAGVLGIAPAFRPLADARGGASLRGSRRRRAGVQTPWPSRVRRDCGLDLGSGLPGCDFGEGRSRKFFLPACSLPRTLNRGPLDQAM